MDDITRQFGGGETVSDEYRSAIGAIGAQAVLSGKVSRTRSINDEAACDISPLQAVRSRITSMNYGLADLVQGLERAADRISGPVPANAPAGKDIVRPDYGHFIGDANADLDDTVTLLDRLSAVTERFRRVA